MRFPWGCVVAIHASERRFTWTPILPPPPSLPPWPPLPPPSPPPCTHAFALDEWDRTCWIDEEWRLVQTQDECQQYHDSLVVSGTLIGIHVFSNGNVPGGCSVMYYGNTTTVYWNTAGLHGSNSPGAFRVCKCPPLTPPSPSPLPPSPPVQQRVAFIDNRMVYATVCEDDPDFYEPFVMLCDANIPGCPTTAWLRCDDWKDKDCVPRQWSGRSYRFNWDHPYPNQPEWYDANPWTSAYPFDATWSFTDESGVSRFYRNYDAQKFWQLHRACPVLSLIHISEPRD